MADWTSNVNELRSKLIRKKNTFSLTYQHCLDLEHGQNGPSPLKLHGMNDTLTRVKHYTKVDGSHFSPGSSDHNKDACLICREPSYIMWLGVPFSLTAVEKIPVVC